MAKKMTITKIPNFPKIQEPNDSGSRIYVANHISSERNEISAEGSDLCCIPQCSIIVVCSIISIVHKRLHLPLNA